MSKVALKQHHLAGVGAALALSVLHPSVTLAVFNHDAKIALHVVVPPAKGIPCDLLTPPPCNYLEENLSVHAAAGGTDYLIYVLVMDADADEGISGAEFGITYNDSIGLGVDVHSWTDCAFQTYGGPSWPGSNSGARIVFGSCQNTPAEGDLGGRVTAILGYFSVTAYGDDVFEVTRRADTPQESFAVTNCSSRTTNLGYPSAAGRASFGTATDSQDPCRGPYMPLTDFESLPTAELQFLQIKLSSMWDRAPAFPLVLQGPLAEEDPGLFDQFQRLAVSYPYDYVVADSPYVRVTISTQELQDVIGNLSSTPGFEAAASSDHGRLSVKIIDPTADPPKAFEALVDSSLGSAAFAGVRAALAGNSEATRKLDAFSCLMDMISGPFAQEVTDDVNVSIRGFRRQHGTQLYLGHLTVTNNSQSTLPSPISVALRLKDGIRPMEPEIVGCLCQRGGADYWYFDIDVGGGLAPAQSVEIGLEMLNPYSKKMSLEPRVFSGQGIRMY